MNLPSKSWAWIYNENYNVLSFSTNCRTQSGEIFNKTVNIVSKNKVTLLFNGVPIVAHDICTTISENNDLSAIITAFHHLNYCQGIYHPKLRKVPVFEEMPGRKDVRGRWRSNVCSFIAVNGKSGVCPKCRVFRGYLYKRLSNELPKPCPSETRKRKMERRYKQVKKLKQTVKVLGYLNTVYGLNYASSTVLQVQSSSISNEKKNVRVLRRELKIVASKEKRGGLEFLLRNLAPMVRK